MTPRRRRLRSLLAVSLLAIGAVWLALLGAERFAATDAPDAGRPDASQRPQPAGTAAVEVLPERSPAAAGEPDESVVGYGIVVAVTGDGVPLADATVDVRWVRASADPVPTPPMTTGTDGECRVAVMPGCSADVRVARDGYAAKRLSLPPLTAHTRVVVDLIAAVEITVKVVDAAGAPVPAASVFVSSPFYLPPLPSDVKGAAATLDLARPAAVTGVDGVASIRQQAPGFVDIVAMADGMQSARLTMVELPPLSSPIVVTLADGASFDVVVTDVDANPLPGWEVMLLVPNSEVAWKLTTNERGSARSPGFPTGTSVEASIVRKNQSSVAMVMEALSGPVKQRVTVPHEAPVVLVARERRCRVRAVWVAPAGPETLTVELIRLQDGVETAGPTDVVSVPALAGQATVSALTDDKPYLLQASGTDSGVWQSQTFRIDCSTVASVELRPTVARTASLDATVTAVGERLDAARIDVWMDVTSSALVGHPATSPLVHERTCRSDDSGRAFVPALLPGRYVIQASHRRGVASLAVSIADATHIDVELQTAGRLLGVVRPPGRPMLVKATESVTRLSSSTLTDAQGAYSLSLAPGDYAVTAEEPGGSNDPFAALPDAPNYATRIASGTTHRLDLARSRGYRDVEVHVHGLDDPEGCTIVFERLNPHDRVGRVTTRAERPVLRSGICRIMGLEGDAEFGVLLKRRADGRIVAWTSLRRGHEPARVDLHVSGAQVRVLANAGQHLRLLPLHDSGVPIREGAIAADLVAAGAATFRHVQPGRYRICEAGPLGTLPGTKGTQVDVGYADLTIDVR